MKVRKRLQKYEELFSWDPMIYKIYSNTLLVENRSQISGDQCKSR